MAPITWRNVDAPNLNRAASILDSAARNWGGGFSDLGHAVANLGEIQRRNQSASALPILARVADEQGVNAALSQVEGMVAPRNRSAELLAAMANLRGTALDYEKSRAGTESTIASTGLTRAQTTGTLAREGRAAEKHNRQIAEEDALRSMAGEYLRRVEGASYGSSPNVSPEFAQHIPGIFAGESGGDYNKLFNHAETEGKPFAGTKLTDMTVNEALEFSSPTGKYGKWVAAQNGGTVATPMGAYQVVGSTLREAAKGLGLTGDEKMTKELQDRIGQWIFENQGLDAWVGYKPQAASGPRLSDLVPAGGGAVPVDKLLALAASGQSIYNTARATDDADRERDYSHQRRLIGDQRSDAEWQEGENARLRNRDAARWVDANRAGLTNLGDAERQILNDNSIDDQTRQARIAAVRSFFGENEAYFQPGSPAPQDLDLALAEQQMQIEEDYDSFTRPDIMRLVQDASGGRSGVQAPAGGGDGKSGSGAGAAPGAAGALDQLESMGALENSGYDGSNGHTIKVARRIADEYNLPLSRVMSVARNAVSKNLFSGDVSVDEDILRQELTHVASLDAYRDLAESRTERAVYRDTAGALQAEHAMLANELAILEQRNTPENTGRIQEIRGRMSDLKTEYQAMQERLRGTYEQAPVETGGRGQGPGAVRAPTPDRTTQLMEQAVRDSGRVDEDASGLRQDWQASNWRGEVKAKVEKIRSDLARAGGRAEVALAQQMADYINRTPEEAAARQQHRVVLSEAREWFGSNEAKILLTRDPVLLGEAEKDPLNFYLKHSGGSR